MIVQIGQEFTLRKPWGGLAAGTRLAVHDVRQGGMFFLSHEGKPLAKGWTRKDRDILRACECNPEKDHFCDICIGECDCPTVKERIADEAKRIVSGARRSAYGAPEDNFERIARFWTAYFQNTGRDLTITAGDVSPLMRLMKEARLCETPDHLDSHVDLVGYALTGAEVNKVHFPD